MGLFLFLSDKCAINRMFNDTIYYEMTLTNVTNVRYNVSNLTQFSKSYADFHGYVSICVCVFGIVTNLFNISGNCLN